MRFAINFAFSVTKYISSFPVETATDFLLLDPVTKSGIFLGTGTLFLVWVVSLHGLAYSTSLTEFKYVLLSEL